MIPIHSKIGQGMRTHFEKLVNLYRRNDLIPVNLESNLFNFYLSREVKPTGTDNLANNSQPSGSEHGRAVPVSPSGNDEEAWEKVLRCCDCCEMVFFQSWMRIERWSGVRAALQVTSRKAPSLRAPVLSGCTLSFLSARFSVNSEKF